MRPNHVAEIAWGLRTIGGAASDCINDGEDLVYRAWVGDDRRNIAFVAGGSPILATGNSLDEAMVNLWRVLTAPGSYVMLSGMKYVFHNGGFQQVFEARPQKEEG